MMATELPCTATADAPQRALSCPCAHCVDGRAAHPRWRSKVDLAPWLLCVQGLAQSRSFPLARVYDALAWAAAEVLSRREQAMSIAWASPCEGVPLVMVTLDAPGVARVTVEFLGESGLDDAAAWTETLTAAELPEAAPSDAARSNVVPFRGRS